MAIRSIDAIDRQAEQRNKQVEAARLLRNQKIDLWIDSIEKNKKSVIDALDTIKYMYSKGLGNKAEAICKQANLYYSCNGGGCFEVSSVNCRIYIGRKDEVHFINIGWSDCGMHEYFPVYKGMKDYTYNAIETDFYGRTYKYLLETTASSLGSRLDTFFELLEKL